MKKLKANNTIKAPKRKLQLIAFVSIVGIIAFLLSMRTGAETLAGVTGWEADSIQRVANDIVRIAITIVVVTIAILIAPVSGMIAAVVGLIALAISIPVIYRYFPNNRGAE